MCRHCISRAQSPTKQEQQSFPTKALVSLGGHVGYFCFFWLGGGSEEASEQVARGGRFLIENEGGVSAEEAWGGAVPRGCLGGKGGVNIFFRGRNSHQGFH